VSEDHAADVLRDAESRLRNGHAAEAQSLVVALIAHIEASLGRESHELIEPLRFYATCVARSWSVMEPEEAHALERAIDLSTRFYGSEARKTIDLHEAFGSRLLAVASWTAAERELIAVASWYDAAGGPPGSHARSQFSLGELYLQTARHQDAVNAFDRALDILETRDERLRFVCLFGKARGLAAMGNHRDAVPLFEVCYAHWASRYGADSPHTREVEALLTSARRAGGTG